LIARFTLKTPVNIATVRANRNMQTTLNVESNCPSVLLNKYPKEIIIKKPAKLETDVKVKTVILLIGNLYNLSTNIPPKVQINIIGINIKKLNIPTNTS
jgi:hypothetical protein